ncbi:MAG: hypothetical protein J5965_09150 [Aeriscardovia sp.]|nr:hypothetical protein [Aeriscardovia sp.]
MKRIHILGIIVFAGLSTNVHLFAQSEHHNISALRDTTSIMQNDSLYNASVIPDTNVVVYSQADVDSLCALVSAGNVVIASKTAQIDSLNLLLLSKDDEIKRLTAERAFVDTCMVRFANRWLYEKFNEQDVNEAIDYFNRILSTQLRRDRSIVLELLKNYKSAYMSFQSILQSAQRDPDRENPFSVADYKARYISKIESMPYYVRYYNESWNIRYLNERIKIALERLQAHSDSKPAVFSDLID